MARDEARHAGFINDALREAGVAVKILGFFNPEKEVYVFSSKIYLLCDLSI